MIVRILEFIGLVLLTALVGPSLHAQTKNAPPFKTAANADEAVKRIEELGGIVRRLTLKEDALEIDFRNSTVNDVHLQYLQSLKNVTIVRLRETRITDAGLAHLAKIATLKRLHLEKTAVTDAGMRHLTSLTELDLLNLFGTEVGDAGLEHLKALPKLRSLYLFQTKVSSAGITNLQKARPGLQVVPDPAQDRERAEAAWKIAKSALDDAEKKFAAAKKNAQDIAPKAALLKKELDDANKKSTDAKKKADDAKKKSDDADKQATVLNSTEAKQFADDAKKTLDETQRAYKSAQAVTQAAQQRSAKAANVIKLAEEAQMHLESYRKLEDDARKRLASITRPGN